MNSRKIYNKSFNISFYRQVERWVRAIFIWSILLILIVTLFPFNFEFKDISLSLLINSFYAPSYLKDVLANILLFFPFGFSLAGLSRKKQLGGIAALVLVLTVSTTFSYIIETLQIFLPSRSPTLTDIQANSLGGFLGFFAFQLFSSVVLGELNKYFSLKKLTALFISYAIVAFIASLALLNYNNFSNWDESFPLLIGNEQTGDRPWNGYVSEITIADKAIGEKEIEQILSGFPTSDTIGDSLVAFYQLEAKESYRDLRGNLTELSWHKQSLEAKERTEELALTSNHWLETVNPATSITKKLRETSQFSLITKLATANHTQTGPARIISLSENGYLRNFTLGQEGSDLVFRLRTPITGENGTKPEIIIPDVFDDTKFHTLIVTYNGAELRFYIDQLKPCYSVDLNPSVAFFQYISLLNNGWNIRLNHSFIKPYKIFYYGIIFIPLGFFLGAIAIIYRDEFVLYKYHIILFSGVILLSSYTFEALLAKTIGRSFLLQNILLSIIIMFASGLLLFTYKIIFLR
jgi:VanZ family protein